MNHDEITAVVTPAGGHYGQGVTPNPYVSQCNEFQRRHVVAAARETLTKKILSLFEPRFITPPETSEFIEALVTMSDSRQILELGTHTGFTSLHILRAIVGKPGAKLVSVDCRPAHDAEFFKQWETAGFFEHIADWTPQCLQRLNGKVFDLVFIDSDHSVDHCEKERMALHEITRPGTIFLFHDVPEWQSPEARVAPPVVGWLHELVRNGYFRGLILPTAEQLDCVATFGAGYPQQLNPHLGVYIRR